MNLSHNSFIHFLRFYSAAFTGGNFVTRRCANDTLRARQDHSIFKRSSVNVNGAGLTFYCYQRVRLFVYYQTCEHAILKKTNEPILMPIDTNGLLNKPTRA